MRRISLLSVSLLALAAPVAAQDIGDELGALTLDNAQEYVGPLAKGLGHALTGGFVSSADPHGMLGFSIGVRAVGALFSDEDKTFQVVVPTSVTYQSPNPLIGTRTYQNPYRVSTTNGRSATVAGDASGAQLIPQGQYATDLALSGQNGTIDLPDGMDIPAAPFAVIDAAVGIGFGTQIMARVIPTVNVGKLIDNEEVGDISAFGVGVMHNLTQWLPIPTPMWDISVVAGTQKMSAGDYLEASGNTIGLVGSAGVGPLSVYAHASSYQASVDVDYTYDNPRDNVAPITVAFAEDLDRTQRLALGAQVDLILLKLSAEYGMGDYKTVSARVAFGLR